MRYEINDGRILTWSLEAHVTDHCNLRCAECCTLSPRLPARAVPPPELARDLARAAAVLRPNLFKLTGGEPLLHPELLRCLEAARASGIARELSVTTNGILLPRMPDAFFAAVDRLTLSVYASAPLPEGAEARAAERCARHGVILTVKRYDRFQRIQADAPHGRAAEVFGSCWLKVRCHLVHRGRFYACTRPPHLADAGLAAQDGVELDGPDLLGRVLRCLEADAPLASCRHCLGATGPWVRHAQLGRAPASRLPA